MPPQTIGEAVGSRNLVVGDKVRISLDISAIL
jgi:hypothetical protein